MAFCILFFLFPHLTQRLNLLSSGCSQIKLHSGGLCLLLRCLLKATSCSGSRGIRVKDAEYKCRQHFSELSMQKSTQYFSFSDTFLTACMFILPRGYFVVITECFFFLFCYPMLYIHIAAQSTLQQKSRLILVNLKHNYSSLPQ